MEDKKILKIVKEDGTTEEVELIISFEFDDNNKEYIVYTRNEQDENILRKGIVFLEKLAYASSVSIGHDKETNLDDFASIVNERACIYIPMEDLIDKELEKERLLKEKNTLELELKRVNGKLNNENFVKKAPQKVVEEEEAKKEKYQEMYNKVMERLSKI